jgi:hypothetical protein
MREDSRVDFVLLAIVVATFLGEIRAGFSSGADDPNWELRWRGLDELDRAWIAKAAMSDSIGTRAALEDRGETELADGFRRREHRRRAYVGLAVLPILIAIAALAVSGLLPHADSSLVFLVFALFPMLTGAIRDRQIKHAYRKAQAGYSAGTVLSVDEPSRASAAS